MTRFEWLSEPSAPRELPWDVDLTPDESFATVPSRGAIVPNWLLVLPRLQVLNLASLPSADRRNLLAHARALAGRLPISSATYPAFFEHGPFVHNSLTGCGVDHAHLHVVPLSFDIISLLPESMKWERVRSDDPWVGLGAADYLLVGDGIEWFRCTPSHPQSQFFRRLIAKAVERSDMWDHNAHVFEQNVKITVDRFR